jgi:hypothetical protein
MLDPIIENDFLVNSMQYNWTIKNVEWDIIKNGEPTSFRLYSNQGTKYEYYKERFNF